MKKIVLAVAAATMAVGAMAADVTMYGRVDLGVRATQTKITGESSVNKVALESGNHDGARWGLKGTEEIADGYKVGFQLEGGFKADTGALNKDGTLFDRESRLFLDTPYGHFGFGKIGAFGQGTGSYGVQGKGSPLGNGYSTNAGGMYTITAAQSVMDNTIVYMSPKFYGTQVGVMYSGGTDATGTENKNTANRYYGVTVQYAEGPLAVGLTGEVLDRATTATAGESSQKTVTLTSSYDFGCVKPFFGAQYMKDAVLHDNLIGGYYVKPTTDDEKAKETDENKVYGKVKNGAYKGFGVALGASAPVLGGTAKAGLSYLDVKADQHDDAIDFKIKRYTVGTAYEYPLSKRTTVYGLLNYVQDKAKNVDKSDNVKAKSYMFSMGVIHQF